jgi:hypothetical protein
MSQRESASAFGACSYNCIGCPSCLPQYSKEVPYGHISVTNCLPTYFQITECKQPSAPPRDEDLPPVYTS